MDAAPSSTATASNYSTSTASPTSVAAGSDQDSPTTTAPSAAIEQVLAEVLGGGMFVGPCGDVAPHSGTDQHFCSLEPTTGSGPNELDVMVGATQDWSGDPDQPFATDFGVVVVHLRWVGSSWEFVDFTDVGE